MTEPIPQSPSRFIIGNAADIDPTFVTSSFWKFAEIYGSKGSQGPFGGNSCLDKDGLFTAYPGEHNWGVAHRILMPVFGPMGIRKMLPEMMDIASQMILKWDRLGRDHDILTADDFTISTPRLWLNCCDLTSEYRPALDTIGLCAFRYRFNEFYSEDMHPFAHQMVDGLVESGKRANRLSNGNKLRIWSAANTEENITAMHKVCDDIIADRKAHTQPNANDLWNAMLNGKDPETGEGMTDENIRYNMVTFLKVAGHETTSGTLAFLFYNLLSHPGKLLAAQKEIDEVLGDNALEAQHLPKLKYVKAAIFETLRYLGPIGLLVKHAIEPTKLRGKYQVDPSMQIFCNLKTFHHDRRVWGDGADKFRPERFLDGGYERLPPNSFKAFGDGPGDKIRCYVKPTQVAFHLPPDPKTLVIMIAAGTGIAPMRGFIQERAAIAAAKQQELGPAILYFGCRHYEKDLIYSDELKTWEDAWVMSVRPAFSKAGPWGHQEYVPERIWNEREELANLFRDGAKILLCGSADKLAKSTGDVCKKIWLEKNPGKTQEDAGEWLDQQREERYVSDVFE
ncbi:cytochrome P450 [Lophium mytilinum]|uniref:Cytochrome P450 n=1 Tax=Lophium mytilinum TaxID=390894 RepID=A0A6A6QZQ1_9PEZI|nr:cytochrome P450 [Lophium mytilinum]